VAAVARFACELFTTVAEADETSSLGTLESVTCRQGSQHVVIRALPGAARRLLVAAGTVTRSGRAQSQVERAATALTGARGERG